jgi:AcrR family transcriptional regulator
MARRAQTTPRKSARQERSKATVDAILDATARVLVKEGYDRASTNRIAEVAGVSVGSLYQYFPSKEALVAALVGRHIDEMRALIVDIMARAEALSLADAAEALVRAMLAAHAVNPRLHKVLVEQTPRVGRLTKLYDIEREALGLAKLYLAAHANELRAVDPELAGFVVVTTVEALTHAAVLTRPELLDDERFVAEATRLIVAYLEP